MATAQPIAGENLWSFLEHIYDKGGLGVLAAVVCLLFLAFIFYKLVWRVWSAALESKDKEIERLIDERNYLQGKMFPDRESTNLIERKRD